MKDRFVASILLFSLLTSILLITTRISPVAASPTTLSINPDPVQKNPSDVCTNFNVSVMIDSVSDLFGFDINITWDNTLITYVADHYNKTLDALWGTNNWYVANVSGNGPGWYKLVAVSTASNFTGGPKTLFKVEFHVEKSCNFPLETTIHFETHKLSDSTANPIDHTTDDGLYQMSATTPDLEFTVKTNKTGAWEEMVPPYEFEYCDWFEVEVNVTHICSTLKDYDFNITFDPTLVRFDDVDAWGVLGDTTDNAGYETLDSNKIHIYDTGGLTWSGDSGLLFALTFHVEFDDAIEHIWRCDQPKNLTFVIGFVEAELSFEEGIINMAGIVMPSPLDITINLIQGDVTCDGKVDIFDLRTVAAYYDKSEPVKYDVKCDGLIDIFDLVIVAVNFGYS
jgi:hypothetical protein